MFRILVQQERLGLQRKPPDQMQSIRHHQKKGTPWRGPVASKEREDYWRKIMGGERHVRDHARPQLFVSPSDYKNETRNDKVMPCVVQK